MLDAKQLRCFVAAAEDLHFARAADRLDMAQSAVSFQIQKLEQELGTRLLNRNKRQPITLTDAGRLFYTEACSALRQLQRAEEVGKLAASGLAGSVRLGYVTSGVTTGLLTQMLKSFKATHSSVRMAVSAMQTPNQLDAIATGELDAGLVRVRRHYPSGVKASVVHSERMMAAVPETHRLAGKAAIDAADLRDETFVLPQFNEAEGFAETLDRLSKVGGFAINSEYRVNDFISAVSLAGAGYGIVVAPESTRLFGLRGVVFKPIRDFSEQVQLALASRKREPSPVVRAFVEATTNKTT